MNTRTTRLSNFLGLTASAAALALLSAPSSAQSCLLSHTYCSAKVTSQGQLPQIGSTGLPEVVTNQFFITLANALPNKSALVITGTAAAANPFQGGTLCVAAPQQRSPALTTTSSGTLAYNVPLDVTLGGAKRYFQVWFRDPAQPDGTGVGLSNGLWTYFAFVHAGLVPPAPSVLVNHMVDADTVQLNWSDNANNETKYLVARLDPGEDPNNEQAWDNVGGDLEPNTVSFQVDGLLPGQTYHFKVRCGNDCGFSDYSNITAVTPSCPSLPAPTNLSAVAECTTQIRLTWTDNSSNETEFRVARLNPGLDENDPNAWFHLGNSAPNFPAFTDTSAQPGHTYKYKVRANDTCSFSAYTNTVTVVALRAPDAPSNCEAVRQGNTPQPDPILITWDHNGQFVTEFRIARLPPGGNANNPAHWTNVGVVGASERSFLDHFGLVNGQTYHYKVRAALATLCGTEYSGYSNSDPANP